MAETLRDLVALHIVVDEMFDQNCYVLQRRDTKNVIVIDPGLQHPRTLALCEEKGWTVDRVLLTHGHPDHVNGVPYVTAAHGCDAAIHPADRYRLAAVKNFPAVPPDLPDVVANLDLTPGEAWKWQELDVAVLETPGHTEGSVCFWVGPDLYAGDTLFRRAVGRTDLPGGSWDALMLSINETLYRLPPDTVVYPGHGEATTIAEEIAENPFTIHPKFR